VVRDNTTLSAILGVGDSFTLIPQPAAGTPVFFAIDYHGKKTCWAKRYFYAVGVNTPKISLPHSWNDSLPPDQQAAGVRDEYNEVGRELRKMADNPYTARLEGHVPIEGNWAIIRLFCFPKAQPNGHDWIAIDSMFSGEAPDEDGTAHGDPP
jgi:hypothetical protein